MNLFNLRVKDLSTGNIYRFQSGGNGNSILEIHFCTSYFQFVVQGQVQDMDGRFIYTYKDLCYVFENANPFDLLAVNEDEKCKYWFE